MSGGTAPFACPPLYRTGYRKKYRIMAYINNDPCTRSQISVFYVRVLRFTMQKSIMNLEYVPTF